MASCTPRIIERNAENVLILLTERQKTELSYKLKKINPELPTIGMLNRIYISNDFTIGKIKNAQKGSMVVIRSNVVTDALAQVTRYKEKEALDLYEFDKKDIPNL